jgi:hypothetical protein
MDDGVRMKANCARPKLLHDARAEPRAAARRCDHQGAVEAEARRFVRHARDRAFSEDHPLRNRIMNE